jgi:hypothetical protein
MNNQVKWLFSVLLLLFVVNGFAIAQEATLEATDAILTQEAIVETPPVVDAPADGADIPYLSPDVAVIAGTIIVVLALCGVFVVVFKALDAVKLSVPQETTAAIGTQIVDGVTKIMDKLSSQVKETTSPVDDMALAVANVPIKYMLEEIKRRTGIDTPAELMIAASVDPLPKIE